MLTAIPCATEVTLKRSMYQGVITGVIIRNEQVLYEVAYYASNEYKISQFYDYEFTVDSKRKVLSIGFIDG